MTTKTSNSKIKMPAYYRAPLKSRKAIIQFLDNERRQRSADYKRWLFTWNVKLYGLNLDFDHLLELYKRESNHRKLTDNDWLSQAREIHGRKLESLEHWAIEDASMSVNDSDCFKMLWSGEELDVDYQFIGRSGGHIALTRFEGVEMSADNDPLDDMPMSDLRKLYRLVVMLDHDFTQAKACAEVEYQAAFILFENLCDDIPLAPLASEDIGAGI